MENAPAEQAPKSRKRHSKKPKRPRFTFTPQVIIAIVGAIATISVALINAKWIEAFFAPSPTATLTVTSTTVSTPEATFTPDVKTPTPTVADTSTPLPTQADPTVSPNQVMWLKVNLDVQPRYDGKVPFRVTFNLQSSQFQLANGNTLACRNVNTCQYSWSITRNGVFLEDFNNTTGIQVYTFTAPGTYIVTAKVCQETACDEDQAEIIVR